MDRISLRYSRILPHQLYNRYDFWDLRTKPDDSRNTHYTVIARPDVNSDALPDERYPGYDLWISVHRSTLRSTWESEQGTASYNDEGNSCSHPGSVDLSTAFSDSVPKKRL